MPDPTLALVSAALLVTAIALPLLLRRSRAAAALAALFVAVTAVVTVHGMLKREPVVPEAEVTGRPIQVDQDGYVSSSACRSCHPHEHATWHDSYHRSMAQVATPQTVLADFDGVELAVAGRRYLLRRRGDEFWVAMEDPLPPPGTQAARVERRIVTTTGSHNMQLYWYESGYGRVTGMLPFAWQVAERRWIPRRAAFVLPVSDQVDLELGSWNYICLKCHATHAKPRLDWDQSGLRDADTYIAEFGIACEACHGPGAEHVARHQNPVSRYAQHFGDAPDPTIVNPKRLDHVKSTQVCGQCHAYWDYFADDELRTRRWFNEGFSYRPGEDILSERTLKFEGEEQFWSDGLIRVAGREYNAMVGSGCFDKGQLSCLSCHVAHQPAGEARARHEWANDMLKAVTDDETCLQCHPTFAVDVPSHTHHAADSAGSRCHNCHMPHTTYGLMKGVRTHRIASPSVASSVETGRPNACNQCHLDRSLGWTAEQLQEWYGIPSPTLTSEQREVSAAVLWTLKGDAAQRALMAWSFGWAPAQQAAGSDWLAPYLAELLVDPYEALRIIAERSLRTLPEHQGPALDLLGAPAARAAARDEVLARWRTLPPVAAERQRTVLVRPDGSLDDEAFVRLLRRRDLRPIKLSE